MDLEFKKEDIFKTIVNLIGAKFSKSKDYDITLDMHYRFANTMFNNSRYNPSELDCLVVYALALVDAENYIQDISPELKQLRDGVKKLKKEGYTAEDIVYFYRTRSKEEEWCALE